MQFLKKSGLNYQSSCKFLFSLFDFILSSFCFTELVKIPDNASALQSYLLMNNTKYDNMLIRYLP